MPIKNDIEKQLKEALKKKNEVVISTLRLILASIKNYEIEQKRRELDDQDIIKVLKREAKKRHESIEAYHQGGRNELADQEQRELDVIKTYLPAEMSAEEIRRVVKKIIEDKSEPVNFGMIMGETMKQLGQAADGKLVSQIVKEAITNR